MAVLADNSQEHAIDELHEVGIDIATVIPALVIVSLLVLLILGWFFIREISRGRDFFRKIASDFDGHTTNLPFGAAFHTGNARIRIFALQGSIHYRARVRLSADPGILVSRKFPRLRFLDRLNYAPTRQRFLFHATVDEHYGFQARETRWMREIFNTELQRRMSKAGRVTRIEIKRHAVTGALLMLNQSHEEHEKAKASIEILNQVVTQVLSSTLAHHD